MTKTMFDFDNPSKHIDEPEVGAGLIKTWSPSAIKTFEDCPYRIYLRKVEGLPEPSGPAAARGTEIHDMAEHFVDGTIDTLPPELNVFGKSFHELRQLYIDKPGTVILEEDWGYTTDWLPCGWNDEDVWARMKLDALVLEDETSARVIDYKTGKRYPVTHGFQGTVYAMAVFARYPSIDHIRTEFWYLDQKKGNPIAVNNFTRDQMIFHRDRIDTRAHRLTNAQQFPAKPSHSSCRWCHYGKEKICKWRYEA